MRKLFIFLALSGGLAYSALAQSGKITGKLTYPSDYLPPGLVLCVTNSRQTYCSSDRAARLNEAGVSFKLNHRAVSYEISLPAGTYYLYATFPKGKAPTPDMEGLKAYYNDFVKCGMSVNCKSKRPIAIRVKTGRVTRGITVGDWYG